MESWQSTFDGRFDIRDVNKIRPMKRLDDVDPPTRDEHNKTVVVVMKQVHSEPPAIIYTVESTSMYIHNKTAALGIREK